MTDMCGRYTIIRGNKIVEVIPNVTVQSDLHFVSRWNVAPSQQIPVIASGKVQAMKWGLIPSWAKDEKIAYKMINARAETIMEKPSYRNSFKNRRCLIPADGFYEWRKNPDGTKTPMYIRMKDQELFMFAGLWDTWRNADGVDVRSCTIITTTPNGLMSSIHDRMPVIIPKEAYVDWEIGDVPQEWLRSYPGEKMEAFSVSTKVNAPKNDDAGLISPYNS